MVLDVAPPRPLSGGPAEPPVAPLRRGLQWSRRGRNPQTTRLLVRLHFLSGLLAAPIILSLAITGILFAWNPQIESAMHGSTLSSSDPGADPMPLSEQVEAARATHPDWSVTAVTPAAPGVFEGRETTAVAMAPPGAVGGAFGHAPGAVSVYVDPATAEVTGEIDEAKRPGEWLRNVHSSWRLGDNVAPVTEMAASWLLVSILTGLYLKWPQIRRNVRRAFTFRRGPTPYAKANLFHTTLGLWLTASLLALVATGLTWTNFAGSRVDDFKATFSSPAPSVSTTLPGGAPIAAAAPDEHAEHGGGGGGAPAADQPPFDTDAALAQIDTVAEGTAEEGLSGVITYKPPTADRTAWKADLRDTKWPVDPVTIAVDGQTGEVVDRVNWEDKPMLAKATSLGVYFHQAQLFGIWTQLFLTVLALAVIALIVSGYRMWWLRRPAGGPPGVGPLWKAVPVPVMILFGLLAYVLPMLAVSFVIYLVLDRLWRAARRKAVAVDA